MKVVIENRRTTIPFRELAEGDVFLREGRAHLKTPYASGSFWSTNCVLFEKGQYAFCGPNEIVTPVESAEIKIVVCS